MGSIFDMGPTGSIIEHEETSQYRTTDNEPGIVGGEVYLVGGAIAI